MYFIGTLPVKVLDHNDEKVKGYIIYHSVYKNLKSECTEQQVLCDLMLCQTRNLETELFFCPFFTAKFLSIY